MGLMVAPTHQFVYEGLFDCIKFQVKIKASPTVILFIVAVFEVLPSFAIPVTVHPSYI